MSGFSFLDRWFKKRETAPASDTADLAEIRRARQTQRQLTDEVQRVMRRLDGVTQELALRAASLGGPQLTQKRAALAAAQDRLRVTLRRLEVGMKQTQELTRELGEWEERAEDPSDLHADHPQTRIEILRSELAVRGVKRDLPDKLLTNFLQTRSRMLDEVEPQAMTTAETIESDGQVLSEDPLNRQGQLEVSDLLEAPSEPMPEIDPAQLIAAIREATREAERWHAIPREQHDDDALAQVRHVRELHALLKRIDRESEVQRDRLVLAISSHEAHDFE